MRSFFGCAAILHLAVFVIRFLLNIEALDDFWFSAAGRIVFGLTTLMGVVSAFYFAVDAFQREYRENRELAIAVAIVGVLTFGLVTAIYYLCWGRLPVHAGYASEFCERCQSTTEEFDEPLDLITVNFVNGGRLIGNSDQCVECGSVVRTHVFMIFGLPLSSRGSFRVLVPDRDRVILRKQSFHWPHLFPILLIPAVVIGIAIAVAVGGN